MAKHQDPSQEKMPFTRQAAILGVVGGAAMGFIAGSLEGVNHHFGGFADVILGVIGAGVGGFVGYSAMKSYIARSNALKDWCREHGWTWLGSHSPWDRGVADFKSAVKKSKIFWKNASWREVLVRDEGDTPAIFAIRSIHRENEPDRTASFLIVHYPGTCPDTTIESPHATDWLPKMDGMHKVEFESIDFNKHWRVFSKDPKSAYDHIDQKTIEYLESHDLKPAIELIDQVLIIRFEPGHESDVGRERHMRWVEDFSEAVPDDLVKPMKMLNNQS